MDMHAGHTAFCPLYHRAVELIGRRWTGAILRALLADIERFSDLTAAIPGLSDRLLSERLKELEAEGIVSRTVIPETPVRIEYHLTEKGRALGSVVEAVSAWADVWLAQNAHTADGCQAASLGRSVSVAGR
jgi:DNA-binding HxlR family transcriptional regulator